MAEHSGSGKQRRNLDVFREKSFRFLFAARTLSFLGDSIVPVALAFALLDMPGGSAVDLGLVLAIRYVAQVVFVLFGGALADRLPRKKLMIASDLVAAATQIVIAGSFILHSVSLPLLLVVTFVNGVASAMFIPASSGLVPQVVRRENLQSANAFMRISMNSASIGGASIAGVLVVVSGPGWALAVDAVTFLASAALLTMVRVSDGEETAPQRKASLLADIKQGWKEFTARSWVWITVAQFGVVCACFNAGIRVLGPVAAKEHLGGASAWAVILAAQSVGLVAGSAIALRVRPRYPMRVAAYATLGFIPCFFILAAGAPVWLVALSLLLNGVCADFFSVMWETSLQSHVPQNAISRISSYGVVGNYSFGPIGLMVAGPLSEVVGVSTALTGCGVILTILNVMVCLSPSNRNLTAPSPEPARGPVSAADSPAVG